EPKLAAVRRGARVIREIAWRLREIGNDSRICDLIDSQVSVIESGAGEISTGEVRSALRAAFASIQGLLDEFGDDRVPAHAVEEAVAAPFPAPLDETLVAVAETIEAALVAEAHQAEGASLTAEAEAAHAETEPTETATAETAAAARADIIDEAAHADDEALLDMVALEMGAPEPYDSEIDALLAEAARIAEPAPPEPAVVAEVPEPIAEPAAPAVRPAPRPAEEPSPGISLGSTIIASGIVRNPNVAANDPLAPIRRMSQVEKIALFS
ncbi:MAG: hypothetical protein WCE35_10965, partial [Bradyrhizobium sp.]